MSEYVPVDGRRNLGWRSVAALVAVIAASAPAMAGGRSIAPEAGAAAPGSPMRRPTIEEVSVQAQREIRACPDEGAFQCVAAALTRYAAALRTVGPDPIAPPPPRARPCHAPRGHACRRS
ncbi:MAG TPA: hypothetical protein VGY52_12935 [Roseiarcus sp.]|nr:hypothetical protein [Roseiarcus sp.]